MPPLPVYFFQDQNYTQVRHFKGCEKLHKFLTKTLSSSGVLWLLTAGLGPGLAAPAKDQSRIPAPISGQTPPKTPDFLLPDNLGVETNDDGDPPEQVPENIAPQDEFANPFEPYDINNIPVMERLELTDDIARRAIDAFADVGTRYDDKGLNDYPTLEEFVAKTQAGKQLEADIKKYGFKDVVEWNIAIMNVSFAFGSLLNDQEAGIRGQIETVKKDPLLSQEKKKKIIASLDALIPTKENVDVIRQLQKLPIYQQKLDLLDAFE